MHYQLCACVFVDQVCSTEPPDFDFDITLGSGNSKFLDQLPTVKVKSAPVHICFRHLAHAHRLLHLHACSSAFHANGLSAAPRWP